MSGRRSREPLGYSNPDDAGTSSKQHIYAGEQVNDEKLDKLHAQVSTLRNITIEIGHEVKEQNRLLDGMGMDFEQAGSMLSDTIKKLGVLTQTERGRNYLFYTVMLIFVIIMILFVRALF